LKKAHIIFLIVAGCFVQCPSLWSYWCCLWFLLEENRVTSVARTLPPTSNAFHHHCHRVARQTFIWYWVYHSRVDTQSLATFEGYETVFGETQLKWLSISHLPSDSRWSVCGKCSSACRRCTCEIKSLVCTLLCECSATKCKKRNNVSIDFYNEKLSSHSLCFTL
jgi:hypothetical protein